MLETSNDFVEVLSWPTGDYITVAWTTASYCKHPQHWLELYAFSCLVLEKGPDLPEGTLAMAANIGLKMNIKNYSGAAKK